VESILEVCAWLIEAKAKLDYGEYEKMIEEDLLFSASTARKLKKIPRNQVLVNREFMNVLPPSWATLYELSFIKEDKLKALIEDGTVSPDLEVKQAHELRDDIGGRPSEPVGASVPEVSTNAATVLRACVQLEEADAVIAFVRSLINPSDIVVTPDEFDAAVAPFRQELAARIHNDEPCGDGEA
jgi:hypothetical protein